MILTFTNVYRKIKSCRYTITLIWTVIVWSTLEYRAVSGGNNITFVETKIINIDVLRTDEYEYVTSSPRMVLKQIITHNETNNNIKIA